MSYETEFPHATDRFLKPSDFQDRRIALTYKGWQRKHNEDDPPERKNGRKWQDKVQYTLSHSYPEWAFNIKSGERIMENGKPVRNRNWLKEYPQGYSIVYLFEEGKLECGSMPLYLEFGLVRPLVGEKLYIKRTGKTTETKWSINKQMDVDQERVIPDLAHLSGNDASGVSPNDIPF